MHHLRGKPRFVKIRLVADEFACVDVEGGRERACAAAVDGSQSVGIEAVNCGINLIIVVCVRTFVCVSVCVCVCVSVCQIRLQFSDPRDIDRFSPISVKKLDNGAA